MSEEKSRNTQFRGGFARLLFGDLMMMDALNHNCNFVDIEQHLARRGYDLAAHVSIETAKRVRNDVTFYYGDEDAIHGISDMDEWPKERE